jgi:HEPN domain-containing protein
MEHPMAERSKDWFAQAERDFRHARNARDDGDYEWACFAAQQSADKAVKAIYRRLGLEGWGHSLKQLLDSLAEIEQVPSELREAGLLLDRYYIPTRYPNGFAQGVPGEYFLAKDAEEAIAYADRILAFIRGRLGL